MGKINYGNWFTIRYKNTLMWSMVIMILCGMPSSGIPRIKIPGIDKMVHFALFFVFATLLVTEMNTLRSKYKVEPKHQLIGFAIAIAYGALTELLQLYVFTSRGADWFDFMADTIGAGIAVLIYPLLNRILRGYI